MATRVLLVEDDPGIRISLRLALEDEGYVVGEAESGEEALDAYDRIPTDLVLIDLMLPGMDGFDLCRQLRRRSDVPAIIITARTDSHDVVAGLEAGADDYVSKPIPPKELAARIRALLRRSRAPQADFPVIRAGRLEIRPEEGVVSVDGVDVALTKTEFRLLSELAQAPGRVLSREHLLERVWGYDYFGDNRLVDVHVRRLRSKVEDNPANPKTLITVRGLGYKLRK
jgi:DNA-binding response OmpR family regulator